MKAPCAGMQGKMLPSVTTEDNGDVLTVVEGAWDKATPSGGGGGNFVVNFELQQDEETVTADKTFSQIDDAFNAGSVIIGYINDTNGAAIVAPIITHTDDLYVFECVNITENDTLHTLIITKDIIKFEGDEIRYEFNSWSIPLQ